MNNTAIFSLFYWLESKSQPLFILKQRKSYKAVVTGKQGSLRLIFVFTTDLMRRSL